MDIIQQELLWEMRANRKVLEKYILRTREISFYKKFKFFDFCVLAGSGSLMFVLNLSLYMKYESFLIFFGIFFIWCIIFGYVWIYIARQREKLIKEVREDFDKSLAIHCNLINSFDSVSTVDEVLEKTKQIYRLLESNTATLANAKNSWKYKRFIDKELVFFHKILSDLRSDISIHLLEQQSLLHSAKSDLTKNLTWTPELLAVSEAQKLRLDRQISQFEELQKKLARM